MSLFKRKKKDAPFVEFTFFEVSWCNYYADSPEHVNAESKMFLAKKEAVKFKDELKSTFEKIGCDLLFSIELDSFSATAVRRSKKIYIGKGSKEFAKYFFSERGRRVRKNTWWASVKKKETF
jgi:hypothetical protein